jgi:hypothetical protein
MYSPMQLAIVMLIPRSLLTAMSWARYRTHAVGTPSVNRLMYPVIDVIRVHVP